MAKASTHSTRSNAGSSFMSMPAPTGRETPKARYLSQEAMKAIPTTSPSHVNTATRATGCFTTVISGRVWYQHARARPF